MTTPVKNRSVGKNNSTRLGGEEKGEGRMVGRREGWWWWLGCDAGNVARVNGRMLVGGAR